MANITATEVRNAGGWTTADISDTVLASDAYIPAADAWTEEIIGGTLASITDADKQSVMKLVNILLCVYLVTLQPPKEGFDVGPIKNSKVLAGTKKDNQDKLLSTIKKACSRAGYYFDITYATHSRSVEDEANTEFQKTYFTRKYYL